MVIAQIGPAAAAIRRFVHTAVAGHVDSVSVGRMDEHARAAVAANRRTQRPTVAAVDTFVNADTRIRWPPSRRILAGRGVDDGQVGA